MKKFIAMLLISLTVFMAACGSDRTLTVPKKDGTGLITKSFKQYGLVEMFTTVGKENMVPDPRVEYKLIVGNVVWAVILSETIVAPVVFVGWYLFEPIGTDPEWKPVTNSTSN